MADEFNFATIQKRVDDLYATKWFQPNACYPVCFFYTDSQISGSPFTIDKFLKFHTNVDSAISIKGVLVFNSNTQNVDGTVAPPKNLTEYLNMELSKIANTGVKAGDDVLRNFSRVTGLKSPTMAVSKKDGTIAASKDESGKDATVNLEFLCDRELKTLSFLQAWESRWIHRDYQKKAFLDKSDNDKDDALNKKHKGDGGGEGFLGILNCSIDVNGNITPLSHLSLFGLIPKNIELPSELGPQAGSNSMPKITVKCTYSNAVLVYPSHDGSKLQYFYYV